MTAATDPALALAERYEALLVRPPIEQHGAKG